MPLSTAAQLLVQTLPSEVTTSELSFSLKVGAITRDYLLHLPEQYDDDEEGKPIPLVVFLHGAGGNALQIARGTGWEEKADQENFMVAFPNGAPADPSQPANSKTNPRIWEDGSFRNKMRRVSLNDSQFLRLMLDDLERRYRIDEHRIYLVGFSNGGGMAFRFAAEQSDRIAAIACVSCLSWLPKPVPVHSLPVFYLVGTRDPLTPLNGGTVKSPWGTYETKPPVLDTVEKWLRWNGCSPSPSEMKEEKGLRTMRYTPRIMGGAEVQFLLVKGMGHHYPGATTSLAIAPKSAGKPVNKLDGTSLIWNFLKRFSRER